MDYNLLLFYRVNEFKIEMLQSKNFFHIFEFVVLLALLVVLCADDTQSYPTTTTAAVARRHHELNDEVRFS